MSEQPRLDRAMAAAVAPQRDSAFVLAVLERVEAERFRRAALFAALRGGAMAAAIAALLVPFVGWAAMQGVALVDGLTWAATLFAILGGARLLARRLGV